MENELSKRLLAFALEIARIAEKLPRSDANRNAADQIIRCSSSAAANYRASQRGRSRKDFFNKVGIALEEADETIFWLDYLHGLGSLTDNLLNRLKPESEELVRILASIRKQD